MVAYAVGLLLASVGAGVMGGYVPFVNSPWKEMRVTSRVGAIIGLIILIAGIVTLAKIG